MAKERDVGEEIKSELLKWEKQGKKWESERYNI